MVQTPSSPTIPLVPTEYQWLHSCVLSGTEIAFTFASDNELEEIENAIVGQDVHYPNGNFSERIVFRGDQWNCVSQSLGSLRDSDTF